MSIYSQSPSPPRRDYNAESGSDQEQDDDGRSLHSGDEDQDNNGDDVRSHKDDPENSEDEEEKKKREKEKKKATKRKGPVRRMVISDDMLTGSKGLSKLSEQFKDFQFRGKGKEKEDLDRILNNVEQWIHTLHPKHPFDQSLERIEFLGTKKKTLKTYLKKMRMGMLPNYSSEFVPNDPMFDDDDSNMFPTVGNETDIARETAEETVPVNIFDSPINSPTQHGEETVVVSKQPTAPEKVANAEDDEIPTLEEQMEFEEMMSEAI